MDGQVRPCEAPDFLALLCPTWLTTASSWAQDWPGPPCASAPCCAGDEYGARTRLSYTTQNASWHTASEEFQTAQTRRTRWWLEAAPRPRATTEPCTRSRRRLCRVVRAHYGLPTASIFGASIFGCICFSELNQTNLGRAPTGLRNQSTGIWQTN